jgi:hypothetical protein
LFAGFIVGGVEMNQSKILAISFFVCLACTGLALAQSWQPLHNQPSFGASIPLLLTDGTVMVQDVGAQDWWKLTPDDTGSYVNGTWTQLASLPHGYGPYAFASAVLPGGPVIVEGGEYNFFQIDWTNQGAFYDTKNNTWTAVAPPGGWNEIGDAESVVLPDGRFMVANCCSFPFLAALLDPKTLTWTPTGANKQDSYDEEGWTLLPDGSVLTVDTENGANPTQAERYIPQLGRWISAGSTVVLLSDPSSAEIGPAVLLTDGTVFATGANSNGAGHTSIYHPPADPMQTGYWVPGPDIPDGNDMADAPAALLPSGNVLCDTNPGVANSPSKFYEYDGVKFFNVPAPPNASQESTEGGSMLVLPTGQILFTDGSSDVEVYTSKGKPHPSWDPVITSVPQELEVGPTYLIQGKQFNGLSQGAMYGDDAQMATNYPLVRITNRASGHVFYARTHEHSTMAVATGEKEVFTHFELASGTETGEAELVVVANGIASKPVSVAVH